MKLQHVFFLLLALSFTIAACARTTDGTAEKAAWEEIRNGALLVDVRSQEEYDAGHLEGALLIPHDQIPERLSEFGDDKDRSIVVYCRSGKRAGVAERMLREAGFTHVLNAGGYEAMKAAQQQKRLDSNP